MGGEVRSDSAFMLNKPKRVSRSDGEASPGRGNLLYRSSAWAKGRLRLVHRHNMYLR
jgi:hypothetical protein